MQNTRTTLEEQRRILLEQIASLQAELAKFLEIYRPYFRREKTFGYLLKYLLGLLADLKRKSIEPIALAAGLPVRTLPTFATKPRS